MILYEKLKSFLSNALLQKSFILSILSPSFSSLLNNKCRSHEVETKLVSYFFKLLFGSEIRSKLTKSASCRMACYGFEFLKHSWYFCACSPINYRVQSQEIELFSTFQNRSTIIWNSCFEQLRTCDLFALSCETFDSVLLLQVKSTMKMDSFFFFLGNAQWTLCVYSMAWCE